MPVIELIPLSQPENPLSVELKPQEDQRVTVVVAETTLGLSLTWESGNSGWAQEEETGAVHRFYTWLNEDQLQLWLNGQIYTFSVPSRKRSERKRGGSSAGPSSGEIKAPMPGSVLKILVAAGTTVEANTPLVIMESMKMEMTLTAPMAGTVAEIRCEAGQLVEMNTVLVRVEPQANE